MSRRLFRRCCHGIFPADCLRKDLVTELVMVCGEGVA